MNEDREQTQAIHRLQREQQTLEGLLRASAARSDIVRLHQQRAAAAEAAVRGESVRRAADLPRRPDAHAARPHEVPDADPRHRAAAPAPAAGEDRARAASRSTTSRPRAKTSPLANRLMQRGAGPLARRAAAADAAPAAADRRDGERVRRRRWSAAIFASAAATCAQHTGWGDTQLKLHLDRLEELEYLLVHRGGRGQSFVYELTSTAGSRAALPGLVGADDYDGTVGAGDGGHGPKSGGVSGAGRVAETRMNTGPQTAFCAESAKNALIPGSVSRRRIVAVGGRNGPRRRSSPNRRPRRWPRCWRSIWKTCACATTPSTR